MKVRRSLALFFLLFGGIILFGHAILPHQHDSHDIRMGEVYHHHHHDHDHDHDHNEFPPTHSHEHQGGSAHHFILDQLIIVPSDESKKCLPYSFASKFPAGANNFTAFSAILSDYYYPDIGGSQHFHFAEKQQILHHYSVHTKHLRGPPVA